MKDFLADYCEKNRKKINPKLFERSFDKPLVDYILDTFKNLEVLPGITMTSYEYITDQTKIHTQINKKNKRDPKIKNNKRLERLVTSGESIYDLLILHYHVKVRTQEADVTRRIWIPKLIDGRWYIRGGKKVLPLIQVVDNSTFVKAGKKKQENILNFKTTLYPIKIFTKPMKIKFVDDEVIHVPIFQLDLFTKIANPLLYFLAQYGLENVLELFCLEKVMAVVPEIIDEDNYVYMKVNNKMYLEIHEKAFRMHDFVGKFVGTLYECLYSDRNKITIKDAYNKDYWLERLSEVFSKKRSVDKGERVLISFKKIMDPYTKKRLCLKKYQKKNTFTIMRWMLTNFEELLKKDSNDLRTKRIRANETQAFFIDTYITKNVNSLLNTDNPSFERYMRLFNSISEDTVFKASHSVAGKSSQSSMYRFERYNDFDAIELSRYTLKGPTGLNGGKKKTSMKYRDIYPSHLGRYDPNVCSSSDPGLTGYLCANVQFDENGYFDAEKSEPNNYDRVIDKLVEKICEDDYVQSRRDIIELECSRDESGFIQLRKRLTQEELQVEFNKYPWQYGLYAEGDCLRIMPKQIGTQRDAKGFMILKPRTPDNRKDIEDMERDEDGFIILKQTVAKQTKVKTSKKKDK